MANPLGPNVHSGSPGNPGPTSVLGSNLVMPNLREFGATGNGITDDTAAINAAINSLPQLSPNGISGGAIYVPPGVYFHEGEITALKKKSNVRLIGAGGNVGGGGIGVGATVGASVFIYGGAGNRAWDFRSGVGHGMENIHCFANGSGFVGNIWDLGGTEAEPAVDFHFINSRAEATRVGGKASEEILACQGANLDFSNLHSFDNCVFSSCENGVKGRNAEGNSSVGHRFNGCFFTGNQVAHVLNPHESWTFYNCVSESLFSRKGIIKKEPGFIICTFKNANTVNVINCWQGSNIPAERKGACITFRGSGLNVLGGSFNTAEIGIFFPEGPTNCTIFGARFWKLNSALTITGKTLNSYIVGNQNLETIAFLTDTIKERFNSVVQAEGAEKLVAAIAEVGAFKTGASGFENEAQAKEIRDKLNSVIVALKAAGISP